NNQMVMHRTPFLQLSTPEIRQLFARLTLMPLLCSIEIRADMTPGPVRPRPISQSHKHGPETLATTMHRLFDEPRGGTQMMLQTGHPARSMRKHNEFSTIRRVCLTCCIRDKPRARYARLTGAERRKTIYAHGREPLGNGPD